MTTITATASSARPMTSEFWFTLLGIVALALALTVWIATRVDTTNSGGVAPGHQANVHTSQYGNQLCAPAPGTRYC